MRLLLYKTVDEKIKINKTLTDEVELNGALRDQSSIISPSILVQTEPLEYNYAYIPEFNRYYFINNIVAYRSKAFVLELKCDVLMSYKDEILELSGVVSRLNEGSEYANRDITTECREEHTKISFEKGFTDNGTYILVTQGGVES